MSVHIYNRISDTSSLLHSHSVTVTSERSTVIPTQATAYSFLSSTGIRATENTQAWKGNVVSWTMGQVCKPREQGEQPISRKSASSDFHVSSDNDIPSREMLLGKQFRRRLEYLSQLHDKWQVDMLPLHLHRFIFIHFCLGCPRR